MRELQQAHTEEREPELDLILEALAQGALATGWSCFGWNFMEEKDGKRGGTIYFWRSHTISKPTFQSSTRIGGK